MSEVLPLTGLRVIEFTHAVMGPAAGLILADMGAEVIRIEPSPHGDHTRQLKGFGTGYYTFYNRNKKSWASVHPDRVHSISCGSIQKNFG